MKVIVDTSSWIALVRYYLPFDSSSCIVDFFERKIQEGQLIIVDGVHSECSVVAKGIVTDKLDFFNNKKHHFKSDVLLPYPKFFHQLENQFCQPVQKRKLTPLEFENAKSNFLQSADAKIILLALKLSKQEKQEVIVVTEESASNNDNKVFRKIPSICSDLGINCMTLPELILIYDKEISLYVHLPV